MKILIIGGAGMLGHKLVQVLGRRFDVFATLRSDFDRVSNLKIFERERTFEKIDVLNFECVEAVIAKCRPDVVINAVGIVKQSSDSNDVVQMLEINSLFPHRLAKLAKHEGFRLITVSTDCVFAGTKGMYSETDVPDALDLYGQTKHLGEVDAANCLTLRTSIIGRELGRPHGLVEWLISNKGKSVQGYANAVFSGFSTWAFADIIGDIAERHPELSGIFHISSDPISKFELLSKINSVIGLGITVTNFGDFVLDRSLSSAKYRGATGFQPPSWDDMIEQIACDPTPYD